MAEIPKLCDECKWYSRMDWGGGMEFCYHPSSRSAYSAKRLTTKLMRGYEPPKEGNPIPLETCGKPGWLWELKLWQEPEPKRDWWRWW